jgi:glycolate oxidase FAD binding subunit
MAVVTPVRARPPEAADEILGMRPETVLEPSSLEEARDDMAEAARRGGALAFVGGGTDLELGAPPSRLDAILRTRGLDRVVEYSPSDQVVVAEGGVTLARLQRVLSEHRQRVALDPPAPERATVGGIVAANAFGPRRARHGSVRDLLIGISFFRADASVARGGGRVVKNVAGFDLPRLMVGSLGTLGLVATATFRLHPVPETEATVCLTGRRAREVRALVAAIREAQLEPASVVAAAGARGLFDVAVRFEGFDAGVVEQLDRLASRVRAGAGAAPDVLDDAAARAFWEGHDRMRSEPPFRVGLAAPPSAIEEVADRIVPPLRDALSDAGFLWYATLGLGFVSGTPAAAGPVAAAVRVARDRLARLGGTLTVRAAPAGVRALTDVWGPPPAALSLMRRLKERLDPEGRLAPGRFVGGI